MRPHAFAAAVLVSALAARPAAAETDRDDAAPATYRMQLLGVDAVGYGLVISGIARDGEALDQTSTGLGVSVLVLASPFVHAAHGEWGRFGGSLGLRYGLSGLGLLAGLSLGGDCEDCSARAGWQGFMLGLVTASIVDAGLQTSKRERRPGWTPQVTARHDGASFGIAGAF